MISTKVKRIFSTLASNLFSLFLYTILMCLFLSIYLFLNLKQINIFLGLILLTLSILTIVGIIKALKAYKNKIKLNIFPILLNIFFIVLYCLAQSIVYDAYVDKDTNLKFLHVFLDEQTTAYRNKLDKYEYSNVIIYHDGISTDALKDIEKCIDKAISRSSKVYTNLGHEKLNFILHANLDNYILSNDGAFADGYFDTFDKTLNMPFFEDSVVDETFENVFVHEYNHYLIDKLRVTNKINPHSLPGWFDEGVSEYFAYGDDFSNMIFDFISFDKLDTYENWNQTLEEGYNAYAQSHYAICYLVKKTSVKSLENIIINTNKLGFEKAFEQEVNMTLDAFLTEFEKLLVDHFYIEEENIVK
ncbi:MAG: hypothetical protein ACRCWG_00860 [Sarcina sp.]